MVWYIVYGKNHNHHVLSADRDARVNYLVCRLK